MTTWQVRRFTMNHLTSDIRVVCAQGAYAGRSFGVHYDARRRCHLLRMSCPDGLRELPVASIAELSSL